MSRCDVVNYLWFDEVFQSPGALGSDIELRSVENWLCLASGSLLARLPRDEDVYDE